MMNWLGFKSRVNLDANLTVCLETDDQTGVVIAHFEQFPDTYAQGKDPDEAMLNLARAIKAVWEIEQAERKAQTDG